MNPQPLVFNTDGTIDTEQLAGYPQEVIDRLTSPEFIAQAREQIRRQMGIERTGRRESRRQVRVMRTDSPVRKHANVGLSGRQKVKLRKIARRLGA